METPAAAPGSEPFRVIDFASTGLIWATRFENLREAARRLIAEEVGALTVAGQHRLAGIFTERDLTQAVADGVDLDATTVDEYMTASVVEIEADASPSDAARQMDLHHIRHMIVVRHGELLGMLSARDLLRSSE